MINVLRGEMVLSGRARLPTKWCIRAVASAAAEYVPWGDEPVAGQRAEQSAVRGAVPPDIYYIENWSLGLDLQIMLRTIPIVLLGNGAY
jgi:hypothetical protein